MEEGNIMALLEQILEENAKFTASLPESYLHRNDKVSKYPARQLAIYTCMDTWLLAMKIAACSIQHPNR